MMDAVTSSMKQRTGRTLEEWVCIVRAANIEGFRARLKWLKETHGIGQNTGYAILKAEEGKGNEYEDQAALTRALFAGERESLYEALAAECRRLGSDVTLSARKTYVAVTRKAQIAQLTPAPKGAVDLNLALRGEKAAGRLEALKSAPDDRISHRIRVTSKREIDAELRRWLKAAYAR
jgi:hypothetical protein